MVSQVTRSGDRGTTRELWVYPMEIATLICFVFLCILWVIAGLNGLDLRKISSWLFGLSGFLCGYYWFH
jgi:hypothetical protein